MKIAIIGGGASGIAAAICAKRNNENNSVTVFERSDRVLRKLLATGNGRCNLSNESISIDNYYSRDTADVSKILSAFTPNEERQFFMDFFDSADDLGIIFRDFTGGEF